MRALELKGRRTLSGARKLGVIALLPVILLLVVTFAVSASGQTTSCTNPATLAGSAFEIDTSANLVVNTPGCVDWLAGGSNSAFRSGVFAKNDKASGSGDDSFGQGASENDANPSIVSGSIPPNKSDLKAFGAFTEATATAKILQLFWSRVQSPSGTTNMDFELNQKFCDPAANPTNCANNGSGVTPETPLRTTGDKLITYDLSKGGTVPAISIRTWSGTAWGTATVISGGANPGALGAVNTTALAAADTGGLGAQDPNTFGEAAINYQTLFPPGSGCGIFGGAYLKSRSSDSFSAEIKDFIGPEKVTVTNCATITTSATPSVTIGSNINDTATLTGATTNATGTMTFKLYGPFAGDAVLDTCTAAKFVTTLGPVNIGNPNGSGDYIVSSGNYQPTATGRYQWVASYTSGDTNNQNATSTCRDAGEASVITVASPAIGTTPSAGGTVGSVTLNDTASVTGGFNPSGTVTFKLYDPTDATCSGTAAYTQTVTLSSGSASTSPGLLANKTGTWRWTALYNGDGNNNTATSGCTLEPVTVTNASPAIGTTPSAGGVVGVTLNDSASVTGGFNPTGTVTFSLWDPDQSGCTGTPRFTQTRPLSSGSASTTGGFATNKTGTWRWTATYNGDGNNNTANSGCNDEQVAVGPASPGITTSQSAGGVVGISLTDSATVSGGLNPTGNVTFKLYDSATCAGSARQTQTLGLSGGNAGPTSGFATDKTGTWSWTAVYNGDNNNNTATSGCNAEQVTIGPASPSISTTPSAGGTVGSVTLNDTASVTGGFNPSGTVTFKLYDPTDATCSGTAAYTQTVSLSSGSASTSPGLLANKTGTWRWTALYNGDGNNNTATSGCTLEPVTVSKADTSQATAQTILPNDMTTISSSLGGTSGSVTFSLFGPGNSTCDLNGNPPVYSETAPVGYSALLGYTASTANTDTTVTTPGTYKWLVVYSGDDSHNGSTSACGVEAFSFDNDTTN